MTCCIKHMNTWAQLGGRLRVTAYSLPLFSEENETGSVTVVGDPGDAAGHWIFIDGRIYVVEKITPGEGTAEIAVKLPRDAFSRKLIYSGDGSETYGGFIASVLEADFIEQADELYALPYLDVSNSDTTAFPFPAETGKAYTLAEIWRSAEAAGVRFAFSASWDALTLAILPPDPKIVSVFDRSSQMQLISQTWSNEIVAKATVRKIETEDDAEVVTETGTFYWHADGTISQTPPSPRIRGKWETTDVRGDKTLADGAFDAMKNNSASYKVEFYVGREDIRLGDTVMLRALGRVAAVKASACIVSSDDARRRLKCGTLATTLTDRIRNISQ